MNQTILPQPSTQPSQPSSNEQNKNKPRSGIINTILLIIIILILLLLSFGTVYALNPTYVQNIVQQITAPVEKVIGPQGNVGNTGEKGEPGARGAQGISGKNGDQGQPGERGLQGISGSSGVSGSAGAQGNDGKIGPQGSTGVLGVTNDSNVTGALSGQNLTLGFSGILPVSRGGTGLNIIPSGALLLGGAGSLSTITPGTNGQILSIVGGVPTYANAAAGFADPLTTTGDIIYRNSSGTTRLAVGTNGQILSVVAGVPAYTNPTAYIAGAGLQLIGNTFSLPGVGTAGTFGSATQIPVITVDAQGRVSTITLQTVATAPVSSVFGRTGIVVAQNGDYTTDQVTEGIANLYFTPSRFTTQFTAKTTDNLAQGTTNKYYATSLFNADFGAKTSDNLTEGVANLYFSNSRARSALSGGVGISYNSTTGVITGAPPISILTAATSTNTIDNIGFQQNWNWNSLTTGIGLQIDSNSLTTGQLVRIASTASVPSGGTILKVDSSGGGPGDAFSVQQFGIDRFKVTAQGQTRIEPVGRLQLVYFTANEPKLQFLDSSGTNFVAFSAPTTVPSNVTWTLPSTDGVSGSVLSTSGSGILSWNVTNGLSSLLAASNSNSIDNLNYDQTWNWSSATTQNPLTIGANALTSGKALNVTSNSNGLVAGGALINANYTGSSTSGSILRAQKNGVNVFSVDTNGNSLVGSGQALTLGSDTSELRFNNTIGTNYVGFKSPATIAANTIWTLPAADGTANQVLTTDGAGLLSFGTPAATRISGLLAANAFNTIDNLNFRQKWIWSTLNTGTGLALEAPTLSTGTLMSLYSVSATTTGNILNVTSDSDGSINNGLARFNFRGDYTGNGLQVDSDNVTNGQVMQISANALTGGRALFIKGSAAYTGGAGFVTVAAGTTSGITQKVSSHQLTSGTGLIVESDSPNITGSLLKVDANFTNSYVSQGLVHFNFSGSNYGGNGVFLDTSTTTGTGMAIRADALTTGAGLSISSISQTTTSNLFNVSSNSYAAVTNGLVRFNFSGPYSGNGLQVDAATATGTGVSINALGLTAASGQALSLNVPNAANQIFVNFSKAGTTAGSITVNGANTAILYNTTSDTRLKSNQRITAFTLADLMKIDVKDYTQGGAPSTGFIAQQLYGVYPLAVSVGSDELDENGNLKNPWQVDYSKVTPLLVKSIQDLAKQVEAQNIKVQIIESKVNLNTTKITSLQDSVDTLTGQVSSVQTQEKTTIIQIESLATRLDELTARVQILEKTGDTIQQGVDNAGSAKILAGKKLVRVDYSTSKTNQKPIVNVTPSVILGSLWAVSGSDATGFTILLGEPAPTDVVFNWTSTNSTVVVK